MKLHTRLEYNRVKLLDLRGSFIFTAGFSSNIVYLVWSVFGGFLLHILLCNYLTVLLKPRLEEPVDSARDLIEKDIIPYCYPGWIPLRGLFNSSIFGPDYQVLSGKLKVPLTQEEFHETVDRISELDDRYAWIGHGEYVFRNWLKYIKKDKTKKFWMSKEFIKLGDYPYAVHLSNKKWHLKKVKKKY